MEFIYICMFYISTIMWSNYVLATISINKTNFIQNRQRKSLIFQNSGQIKLVIGPVFPIQLDDPIPWRSLVCLYNLQGGHYNLPTTPLYPWDNTFARSLLKKTFRNKSTYNIDNSRSLVYTALENYLNSQGSDGHVCLLHSICENAQVTHHIGILHEIINVVLTPGKEKIDKAYREAYNIGILGANCTHQFPNCSFDFNILHNFSKTF